MSYEAFREQCAKICEDIKTDWQHNHLELCAKAIRALPLPEVKQEPYGWRLQGIATMPDFTVYSFQEMTYWRDSVGLKVTELYQYPSESCDLFEDNKQLRKALNIAVLQNRCDMLLTGDEIRICEKALKGEYL